MTTKIKSGVIGDNVVGITQLNVSDGTNGQVLTTDGSGTLSFSTISGYTDSDVETYLNTSEVYTDATNNRLGIGTSSPEKILHIKTSVNNTAFARIESTATDSYPTLSLKNDAREYQLTTHGPLGDKFTIYDGTAGAHRFVIDSSGNVGIGTTSPSANLHVSSSGDTIARITSADGNGAFLDLGDASDPDGGRIVYDSGSNLGFSTASTERMRIDSSGRVGIGTSSPSRPLTVNGNNGTGMIINDATNDKALRFRATGDAFFIEATNNAESAYANIALAGNVGIGTASPTVNLDVYNGSGWGGLDIDGTSGGEIRLQKAGTRYGGIYANDSTGLVILAENGADSTKFFTGGSERMRILSSGGITFNGDTSTANALDDYEEGTWTPALDNITTNSSTMYGIYTKIGNICHIHAKISVTVASLPGAQFQISGLPFTATNTSDTGQRAIIAIGGDCANTGAAVNGRAQFITNGSTLQGIYLNSGTTATFTYNIMDSSTFELHIHGFYTTT